MYAFYIRRQKMIALIIKRGVDSLGTKTMDVCNSETEYEQTGSQKFVEILSDILFYLLLIGILAAAIMFASSKTPDKSIFGYRYYDVLTGSMTPAYHVGDLIFVKITPADGINVGDPVTFNPGANDDSYLTHRVVEKLDDYQGTGVTCFRTKGDANDTDDPFIIDATRMIGVVKLRIPILGFVVQFVQYHYIMIIVFIILFSVFFTFLKKLMAISAEIKALEAQEKAEVKEA
jgi:signal peptidase